MAEAKGAGSTADRAVTLTRRGLIVAGVGALGAHVARPWWRERQLAQAQAQAARFAEGGASFVHPAIGDTSALPPEVQRALAPSALFAPLPTPGPHDWQTVQQEAPQTFADYRASSPNLPDARRRTIYIVPLGDYLAGAPELASLAAFTQITYGLPVKVGAPIPYAPVGDAQRVRHDLGGVVQWHAGHILARLEGRLPSDAYCLIAVTTTDLWPGARWSYVFGQATLTARVGVFSFARYLATWPERASDPPARVWRRSAQTLTHEIGHMFGMEHCLHFACNLNGSGTLEEADRAPLHLCPVCLRKLYHAAPFSPIARYEALARLARAHKAADFEAWLARRVAAIRAGG